MNDEQSPTPEPQTPPPIPTPVQTPPPVSPESVPPTPNSVPPAIPSMPTPTPPKKKHTLLISLVISAVVIIVGIAAAGVIITLQQQKQAEIDKQKANANSDNWTKFVSKEHGISFEAPKTWIISDNNDTQQPDACTYTINISPPELNNSGVILVITSSSGTLSELSTELKQLYSSSNVTATYTEKPAKWNGHDAEHVIVKTPTAQSGVVVNSGAYYVQIGDCVYSVPDYENPAFANLTQKVSDTDWKKFTSSIQITGTSSS